MLGSDGQGHAFNIPEGHVLPLRTTVVPEPRTVFLIRWRRFSLPWQHESCGVGQVLALEPGTSIVHVRLFSLDHSDEWPYAIGHIPLTARHLAPYVKEERGRQPLRTDFWEPLNRWRGEYARGEASAFGVPLPKAVSLILQTVDPEGATGSPPAPILTAYPVLDDHGKFTVVRAVACEESS